MALIRHYCGSLLVCVFGLVVIFFLASLGVWQLGRADQKQTLLAGASAKMRKAPISLEGLLEDEQRMGDIRYTRVQVEGCFISDKQFLLDNQIKKGVVGYNVITPFVTQSKRLVLVDRGWVPQGISRELIPDLSLEKDCARFDATVYVPLGKAYALGGMDDGEITWPRIIQFLDFPAMGARLGQPALPFTLRMAPEGALGYKREWRVVSSAPGKHLAYAFQWFAMAIAVLVLMVLNAKRRVNNGSK